MDQPGAGTLRGVVEQTRQQQLALGVAPRPERRHDIETVSTVGSVHPPEQVQLRWREPGRELLAFLARDPTRQVPQRLAGLAAPP
jgi:hypothetical protein